MKKHFIIALFTGLLTSAYGQDFQAIDTILYNCYYNYYFQIDSTNKDSFKNEEMLLQVGRHSSRFSASVRVINDSIGNFYSTQAFNQETAKKLVAAIQSEGGAAHLFCTSSIYKNVPTAPQITQLETLNKQKVMTIQAPVIAWTIVSNTDSTIQGYRCTKATTRFEGRNYVAWFTPDIPIADGPYKFSGLPGLIVKISDTKGEHHFELDEFSRTKFEQVILFPSKKPAELTASEYHQAWKTNLERLTRLAQSHQIQMNDEKRAQAVNKFKLMNNYIEKQE